VKRVNQVKRWKKIALWALAVMVVLVAGGVITLMLLVGHSENFRRGMLAKAADSLHESTGATLEARDFRLSLSRLTLDLYGVVVRGREADRSRPLLALDHLQVGLTIDSLLRRKWHVRSILIEHPVARLAVSRAGESNLPQPRKSTSGGSTNIFDLAIRELKLSRGEIYYNDRKIPMDAEVRDFALNADYDAVQSKYSGELGYDHGKIVYGAYAPAEHGFHARFGATAQKLTVDKLEVAVGESRLALSAAVNNYSSPELEAEGSYEATVVASDLRRILKDASLPSGTVRLAGQLNYRPDPSRPLLETVSVNGNVASSELALNTETMKAEVRDLYAHYTLAHGDAEVSDVRAHVMGGTVSGRLTIRDVAGASIARLQASLKDLSLEQAEAAVKNNAPMRQTNLSGKVSAEAEAHWSRMLENLTAHSDATIQASIGRGPATPLNGVLHADYLAAGKQVALNNSSIRTPKTTINLNGKVSDRSQLLIVVDSSDLHELEMLAAAMQKPAGGQKPEPVGLYGTAHLSATVSGSLDKPQMSGKMQAANLRVKGSAWKILRTDFWASPQQASFSNGELEAVPQGRIQFSGEAHLKNWVYTPESPIAVNVSGAQISVADLERLANQTYPVSGTLALNVSVRGSQFNPVGQGSLTVANAKVSGESIQNIHIGFHGDGKAVNAQLKMQMPAGVAQADLDYFPASKEYRMQMRAQDFRLEKLETVKSRNMQIAGGVNLNANGKGTISDPQLQARVEIPQLQMKEQAIRGIKLETTVEHHVARIALDSELAKTFIRAQGTIGIESPYIAELRLDTGRIELQPLAAIYEPDKATDFSGQTELHATIRGPLGEKSKLEAQVEVPVLAVNYKQMQLAAAKPIRMNYRNGTATLEPAEIRGTGTTIDAQATVPVTSGGTALMVVQGNVDLKIAELLVPGLQSSGQIQFDVNSRRYGAGSDLNGQIKIVNANLHTVESTVGLDHANGVFNVTQTRLEIASFQGEVGGGTINATGAVTYRPGVQFQLGLRANNVRVRYPDGVRSILASDLALRGNPQQSTLSGQVRIEHISFTPDFDLNTFLGQFSGESVDSGTPGSLAQGMKLDIAVQSTSQMNLTSSQVSLRGDANLRVVGTAAMPVILGRANLTGGEFFLAGNRYEVQHGTIGFANPVRTEPVLNVQVRTKISEYNINLGLNGPVSHLQTTYTSDPALPPVDIINLVARGKTLEAQSATSTTTGAAGAQGVLAAGIGSQVGSKIAKLAGLSQLQIDPGVGTTSGQQNPGARIAVQQRVTSNLLVTFATDITSTQNQAIQVEYRINPKWSVGGTRNQNGGFGFEGRYHKDF
jgi:translocation and assembly module TamB